VGTYSQSKPEKDVFNMRALRYHGNKDIRVDEIEEPKLRPGWVKVNIGWAGICGSDLHEYMIGPNNVPLRPHVLTGEVAPTILGHEFSGTITELGDGVTNLKPGQKVAIFPIITDGSCYWCKKETYGLCESWGFLGYSGYGGGFAEYICVEAQACHVLPDDMGLDIAALVEPLAVGWHSVKIAQLNPGDDALVIGAGPIGIAVVHCLLAHGITSITVSEPSELRRSHAKNAGTSHVVNPIKEDLEEFKKKLGDGRGFHAIFECAGVQAGFDSALANVRGRGKIVNLAIYETPLVIKTPNIINRRQLTYVGSNTYTRGEFQEVIDAIASGKIKNPEGMITGRIPLKDAVVGGFEALITQREKHVKILVDPNAN